VCKTGAGGCTGGLKAVAAIARPAMQRAAARNSGESAGIISFGTAGAGDAIMAAAERTLETRDARPVDSPNISLIAAAARAAPEKSKLKRRAASISSAKPQQRSLN